MRGTQAINEQKGSIINQTRHYPEIGHREIGHRAMGHQRMDHSEIGHPKISNRTVAHQYIGHSELDFGMHPKQVGRFKSRLKMGHQTGGHRERSHPEFGPSYIGHDKIEQRERNHPEMGSSYMGHEKTERGNYPDVGSSNLIDQGMGRSKILSPYMGHKKTERSNDPNMGHRKIALPEKGHLETGRAYNTAHSNVNRGRIGYQQTTSLDASSDIDLEATDQLHKGEDIEWPIDSRYVSEGSRFPTLNQTHKSIKLPDTKFARAVSKLLKCISIIGNFK